MQSRISQKVGKKKLLKIDPSFGCGEVHLFKNSHFKNKECKNCGNKGHKFSHYRKKPQNKMKNNNLVHCTIEQKAVETIKRKYINVQLNNKKVKFQLVTGSHVTMINAETLKRIDRPTLISSKKSPEG